MNRDPVEPPLGGEGRPEGPGGGHDDDARGSGIDHVVVPDDARELARDLQAWQREERSLRRRRRWESLLLTRRWHDRGISGLIVALILIGVAMLGATISLLTPRAVRQPTPPVELRLAAPAALPGTPGGLLPDASLKAATGEVDARGLRPGIIAIVPAQCSCRRALSVLAHEASTNALQVYLIGGPAQAGELADLTESTAPTVVQPLVDVSGALVEAYAPRGLTVVQVHADGVTEPVVRDYTGDTPLGRVLVDLKQAGPNSAVS